MAHLLSLVAEAASCGASISGWSHGRRDFWPKLVAAHLAGASHEASGLGEVWTSAWIEERVAGTLGGKFNEIYAPCIASNMTMGKRRK